MSDAPENLHYSEEHEYLKQADDNATYYIGITDYAQGELGDVVFVELPDVGAKFSQMDVFGTIEAVKAVSELFCPVTGEIVDINQAIEGDPGLVNRDPYGEGWMVKIRMDSPDELSRLLSAADYKQHIGE
jgi:glycine cleavage system H protein